MALDMAKYRKLFLEEASEHLSEISAALLELEKDSASVESIDVIFRMAHSVKSMAFSDSTGGLGASIFFSAFMLKNSISPS